MVRPEGIEPPAYRFEACRSIHLSYGRTRTEAYRIFRPSATRRARPAREPFEPFEPLLVDRTRQMYCNYAMRREGSAYAHRMGFGSSL